MTILEAPTTFAAPSITDRWVRACAVDELEPFWAEALIVHGRQIALVMISATEIYAVCHRDPATNAYVIARGIVGSRGERPTIASPLLKHVYDLATGECLTDPSLSLRIYRTRIVAGDVEVEIAP